MYIYDFSWALPKPQINGPSTPVKMSTLPKTKDIVGLYVYVLRQPTLVTLCSSLKTFGHYGHLKSLTLSEGGDMVVDSTLCG